jgi:hypothetical protein
MLLSKQPGMRDHQVLVAKAAQAKAALVKYTGHSAWVIANEGNPAALRAAEELVHGASMPDGATSTPPAAHTP